ncbi:Cytochrome bd-type quinal oxidase subunit 2 [Alcanivorax hongdengensis A-11-3]|uniref:Cytochrome bd-type quinal oxidase subunit 2 n=1 Tax=Alcanivorax hongdengensis A-11-3 TaxID=1177179 RepID=L0WDP4_9GAMM|nr:cytochrome d ubiquinol oxidase subunit II [Alcanivorax hongdengensis]EKF74923.1 Cytochrome bd-type quinal oxidase subunit 2 [Alcanivorax hongdengensis A-11-3]
MMELLNYENLRLIWWLFIGVLLIGFAVMDGFDLGVAAMLPFVARTDNERRVAINSIGPTWEGNQVWFILGGGAVFAAFPLLYATAFSGFYFAMFLVLVALIVRPVGFDFRHKIDDSRWRAAWDTCLFIGGVVPAVVFGVAIGNLFLGVPFTFDEDMRLFYTGGFWALLNPFALLVGVVSLSMLVMQGATFLSLKTEGDVARRAGQVMTIACAVFVVTFIIAGIWVSYGMDGYVITSEVNPLAPSNPLAKTVSTESGAWLANYTANPLLFVFPVIALAGALGARVLVKAQAHVLAFISSSLTVAGTIATAGASLFPFFMPSSQNLDASLTLWDASSSHTTLMIMFFATLIFLPLIIIYTSWIYRVMRGKVTEDYVKSNSGSLY